MPEAGEDTPIGSGFTEGELKFASFWVRYKLEIRRAIYAFVIFLNIVFWGYSAWQFLDAYALSYPRESRIPQEIAENEFVAGQVATNRPNPIGVRPVTVFQTTDNRLDMIAAVRNANTQWLAEFTYRFNVSGEQTPVRSGFILPGKEIYLGEFGFAQTKLGGKSAVLMVDDLKWKRVNPEVVGADYKEWVSRRDAFTFTDVKYARDIQISGKTVARTTFTFGNPTAFGYWNVPIMVVLLHGDTPVAATTISLSRVTAGDSRNVSIDWFENLPSVTDTRIIPMVNFLDSSVYLPIAGN